MRIVTTPLCDGSATPFIIILMFLTLLFRKWLNALQKKLPRQKIVRYASIIINLLIISNNNNLLYYLHFNWYFLQETSILKGITAVLLACLGFYNSKM